MKFINVPVFIASLCIGLFISYISLPSLHTVFVYPTPDNINKIQYKDDSGTCFGFTSHKVKCPTDKKLIREYPVQNTQKDHEY